MNAIHATITKVSTVETGDGETIIRCSIPRNFFSEAAQWDQMRVLITPTNIDLPFGPVVGISGE